MSTPKIVFVDGPNGSGKDYFIDNLINHYKKNNPHKNVETIHLSEYTRSVRDLTGSRFSDKTNTMVFLRHINALVDLKKLADDPRVHLVVVNRSFSSFLCYNVPVVKQDQEEDTGMLSFVRKFFLHEADCSNPEYDTNEPSPQEKERQEFLTTYMNVFKSVLCDVKTCYVSLVAPGYSVVFRIAAIGFMQEELTNKRQHSSVFFLILFNNRNIVAQETRETPINNNQMNTRIVGKFLQINKCVDVTKENHSVGFVTETTTSEIPD
jgi:hypothetical protein